jgi:hypothetical protein
MAAMRCEPLRIMQAPADKCLLRRPRFFEVPLHLSNSHPMLLSALRLVRTGAMVLEFASLAIDRCQVGAGRLPPRLRRGRHKALGL